MMSLFNRPQAPQTETPEENPIDFRPFQRYRGRDEIRKQAIMRTGGAPQPQTGQPVMQNPSAGPMVGPGGMRPPVQATVQPRVAPMQRRAPIQQPIAAPVRPNYSLARMNPYTE